MPVDIPVKYPSCPIQIYFDKLKYPKTGKLLKNFKCPITKRFVAIRNGIVYKLTKQPCVLQCIYWDNNLYYRLGENRVLKYSQSVVCSYFIVGCNNIKKSNYTEQIYFTAFKSNEITVNLKPVRNQLKSADVILIGINYLYYSAFEYFLPTTFTLFHQKLNGVSFKKFNKRFDSITSDLLTLLSGSEEIENYKIQENFTKTKVIDEFNWIWKHYKNNGYITLFADEMIDFGIFRNRLKNQPTDFFLHTPLLLAKEKGLFGNFCVENQPFYFFMFEFFNDFHTAYMKIPKFMLAIFNSIPNNDNKYMRYLDKNLAEFIYKIKKKNHESLIVLYSNHEGKSKNRFTSEEKLQFLGISLPKSKENLIPILKRNSEVLISGLDLHATLEDFIDIYKPNNDGKRLSLLRPLPTNRNCDTIDLSAKWCSCLIWKIIENPNENNELVSLGKIIVKRISDFTNSNRKLCSVLNLYKILDVHSLDVNFKTSINLSNSINETNLIYRLKIQTEPGDAQFQLTVSEKKIKTQYGYEILIDKFYPTDVSRINQYSPWIRCLKRQFINLTIILDVKKFCICKDAL